jgi:hypothetical protein
MIFFVIAIFIGIGFFESRSLIKNKCWGEFAAFISLLTVGFTLILLQTLGIKIPSAGEGINLFVENVMHLGYK